MNGRPKYSSSKKKLRLRELRYRRRNRHQFPSRFNQQPEQFSTIPQPQMHSMSNNWFWNNYYTVLNWQNKHRVAYWKSKAIALQYENDLLHQYIESIITANNPTDGAQIKNPMFKGYAAQTHVSHSENDNSPSWHNPLTTFNGFAPEKNESYVESDEEEYEIEVSEEMKAFVKQSMKHKIELKLQKKEAEEGIPSNYEVYQQELITKHELYGSDAPMIIGMETAMEVSFQRVQDLKGVQMWPQVPLKI